MKKSAHLELCSTLRARDVTLQAESSATQQTVLKLKMTVKRIQVMKDQPPRHPSLTLYRYENTSWLDHLSFSKSFPFALVKTSSGREGMNRRRKLQRRFHDTPLSGQTVRLRGAKYASAGYLELRHPIDGRWGYVCDPEWTYEDAGGIFFS